MVDTGQLQFIVVHSKKEHPPKKVSECFIWVYFGSCWFMLAANGSLLIVDDG